MTGITHIVFLALVMTASMLFTLRRVISFRRMFGYSVVIDLSLTILLVALFHGTVSGAASATLSGLFLAIFLTVGRAVAGAERVRRAGGRWVWVEVQKPLHGPEIGILRGLGGLSGLGSLWGRAGGWAEAKITEAKHRAAN